MTNGHGIGTPANKIATARATLGLACRLNGAVEEGRITTEIFKRGVTVYTSGAGLRLPVSVTAYHFFGGEVEALNTPTIGRLTLSCRHQLLALAHPAVADLDWPNELRVSKFDIPYNSGASDLNPRERHFFPLRRPCHQVRHKARRDRAADVLPARVFLFLGIEWEIRAARSVIRWGLCAAMFVKVGPLTLLD